MSLKKYIKKNNLIDFELTVLDVKIKIFIVQFRLNLDINYSLFNFSLNVVLT